MDDSYADNDQYLESLKSSLQTEINRMLGYFQFNKRDNGSHVFPFSYQIDNEFESNKSIALYAYDIAAKLSRPKDFIIKARIENNEFKGIVELIW